MLWGSRAQGFLGVLRQHPSSSSCSRERWLSCLSEVRTRSGLCNTAATSLLLLSLSRLRGRLQATDVSQSVLGCCRAMDSVWVNIPKVLCQVVVEISQTRCSNTWDCRLRCFCSGHRECGRLLEYGRGHNSYKSFHAGNCGAVDDTGRCFGHVCQTNCDVKAGKALDDLISSCRKEMSHESDISYNKFILGEMVIKTLVQVREKFQTKCIKRYECDLRCLGCSGHRECFRKGHPHLAPGNGTNHASNCGLHIYSPNWSCGKHHTCGSKSPNEHLAPQLTDLGDQVTKLLATPFGPHTPVVMEVADSASLLASQATDATFVASQAGGAGSQNEVESAVSCTSSTSWLSATGPHCFLPTMLFRQADAKTFYMYAQELVKGSRVLAADEVTQLEVIRIQQQRASSFVVLHADGTEAFKTTPSHRVMTPNFGGEPLAVKAGELKVGDFVLCTGHLAKKLIAIDTVMEDAADVIAITFSPDLPVAVFMPAPSVILTRGLTIKPTRRGGMKNQSQTPYVQTPAP